MHQPLHIDFKMPLSEIATAMRGKVLNGSNETVLGVALDTRALKKGDLFFALEAARDGHEYVDSAFEKGAMAAVIHKEIALNRPTIRVKDTQKALWELATSVRRAWGKKIVAIGGSNGKTTTKEMTGGVLGAAKKTHRTPGTWNNHLGVPLTLLLLKPEHEVAVLELGINDFGEMTTLAQIAEPNIAVLTNVGPEHLEKFKSIDGVAKAEGELFQFLTSDGCVVVNADDPNIEKLSQSCRAKKITLSLTQDADLSAKVVRDLGVDGVVLNVKYGSEQVEIHSPFLGTHNVYNLLCAFGAAYAVGVPAAKLQAGVNAIERPEMRLQTEMLDNGVRMIVDCYNANPASTAVALDVTKNLAKGRMIAVLGDMRELGEISARAHRDAGVWVAERKFSQLFVMGSFAGDIAQGAVQGGMSKSQIRVCSTHDEMAQAVFGILTAGDTIVVKGSRGMKLEKVADGIRLRAKGAKA